MTAPPTIPSRPCPAHSAWYDFSLAWEKLRIALGDKEAVAVLKWVAEKTEAERQP